jgi:undecaprenol kinase
MKKLFKSFTYAFRGLLHAFVNEQNFAIEIFCVIAVIAFSIVFNINTLEWFVVIINIGIVLMAELFNTAMENICNMIHKETHPVIKIVKDVSAAAVVIAAACALVCACIIFIPHFSSLLKIFLS